MKNTLFILGVSLSFVMILSGCQNSTTKISTDTPEVNIPNVSESITVASSTAGLANPASTNCIQKGGKLEMRNNKNGEYGVCIFEDNLQCEEWALLRNECPVGGVKITGYNNDAEIYCAITGGQVEGVGADNPMCKKNNGTYCYAHANLDGECPNSNNSNSNVGNEEVK